MPHKRSLNLVFHGIGAASRAMEPGEEDYWLDEDDFQAVLRRVAPRDDIRLSFDDGNASDLEIALPALVAYGLRASFFVVVGRVDGAGFLTRAGIRRLAEAGMGIGSHGMHHKPWRGLPAPELEREVRESRRVLGEIVDRPVHDAACPFGQYDRTVLRSLRKAGYERVYTSDGGLARTSSRVQPRTSIPRSGYGQLLDRLESARSGLSHDLRLLVRRWR